MHRSNVCTALSPARDEHAMHKSFSVYAMKMASKSVCQVVGYFSEDLRVGLFLAINLLVQTVTLIVLAHSYCSF